MLTLDHIRDSKPSSAFSISDVPTECYLLSDWFAYLKYYLDTIRLITIENPPLTATLFWCINHRATIMLQAKFPEQLEASRTLPPILVLFRIRWPASRLPSTNNIVKTSRLETMRFNNRLLLLVMMFRMLRTWMTISRTRYIKFQVTTRR